MIFDIGLFGGGEESNSFTQERFTDHEGEDVFVYLYLGIWVFGERMESILSTQEIFTDHEVEDNVKETGSVAGKNYFNQV